jgi:hypothetical protein
MEKFFSWGLFVFLTGIVLFQLIFQFEPKEILNAIALFILVLGLVLDPIFGKNIFRIILLGIIFVIFITMFYFYQNFFAYFFIGLIAIYVGWLISKKENRDLVKKPS